LPAAADCAFAYLTERKRLFAREPAALWGAIRRAAVSRAATER